MDPGGLDDVFGGAAGILDSIACFSTVPILGRNTLTVGQAALPAASGYRTEKWNKRSTRALRFATLPGRTGKQGNDLQWMRLTPGSLPSMARNQAKRLSAA
jgi:hypothetical protein